MSLKTYFGVGRGCKAVVTDPVLLFFFNLGGFVRLSLLEELLLFGSLCSISSTFVLIKSASGQCLAILCSSAVVEDVLKSPKVRRLSPWLKHASTAAHKDVTDPDSSCTYFFVTASSINCFTSFFTFEISLSLLSVSEEEGAKWKHVI